MLNGNATLRLQDVSETPNPGGATLLGFRRLWRGARPVPGRKALASGGGSAVRARKETTC